MDLLLDSWGVEEEPDSGIDGQRLMRKPSSSLPTHLQPAPLESLDRKGSASLPLFWDGFDAMPAQHSSMRSMPGSARLCHKA